MALPTQVNGFIVTEVEWNELIDAVNRAGPKLAQTVTAVDGNGSIALTTGEETHVILNINSSIDINGMSVPDRFPWSIYLVNVDLTDTLTLKNEDPTEPTPAKRLLLPGATDFSMPPGQGILLEYISVPIGARWCSR